MRHMAESAILHPDIFRLQHRLDGLGLNSPNCTDHQTRQPNKLSKCFFQDSLLTVETIC